MGSDEIRRGSFQVANTNLPASLEKLNWRISQRGNSYVIVDGFHLVVFRRQTGEWSVRIEEVESGETWYPEGRYSNQIEAQAAAFPALKRITSEARPTPAVRL